jgi:translation initiation factor IF-3
MPQIRLIDQDSAQRGVVDTYVALREARDLGLDLVEIAPHERPPVCRIMDYGRHQYTLKKRQKQSATHEATLKEVRLRPKTDDNDRNIKIARAEKFLTQGHKVQFTMLFRGRERQHSELARTLFMEMIEHFGEAIKVERMPKSEGRRMTMVIAPTKKMIQIKPKKKVESTKKPKEKHEKDNVDADASAPSDGAQSPLESSESVDAPPSDAVENDMVTNEERT